MLISYSLLVERNASSSWQAECAMGGKQAPRSPPHINLQSTTQTSTAWWVLLLHRTKERQVMFTHTFQKQCHCTDVTACVLDESKPMITPFLICMSCSSSVCLSLSLCLWILLFPLRPHRAMIWFSEESWGSVSGRPLLTDTQVSLQANSGIVVGVQLGKAQEGDVI